MEFGFVKQIIYGALDLGKKKLLVTGASGFVGTNFLNSVKNDSEFEILATFHSRKPSVQARNISYVQADLRKMEVCKKIVTKIDYVCMFAGRLSTIAIMNKHPLGPITENTIINMQMLEAAYLAKVKKFLWLGSTTGYPKADRPLREDSFFDSDPPVPYESIGWMSRYIEKISMLYATKPENPMTIIVLRPTSIFGPRDDFDFETCHALPALMRRVIEKQSPIEIWGTGEDERDWLYIDDLIDACLLALERLKGYESLNIGTGRTCSLNQLLKYILEIDGDSDTRVVHLLEKAQNISVRRFDCSRAKHLLGFKAKTPIKEGLKNTIKWYKENRCCL